MSAPKPGDRVRVEYEGVVRAAYPTDGWLDVLRDGAPRGATVPPDVCTVLAPPIKEGDVITDAAQLDGLPNWSIVAEPGWSPLWRAPNGWTLNGQVVDLDGRGSLVVLRIGGGES